MNRLIIIGNGFDLAHGLNTDYNSFIKWYLKGCLDSVSELNFEYYDDLIYIKRQADLKRCMPNAIIKDTEEYIEYFYNHDFSDIQNTQLTINGQQYFNPFLVEFKSDFSKQLFSKFNFETWVDIENEFYSQLKKCKSLTGVNVPSINSLNNSLKYLISKLEIYLSSINYFNANEGYAKIFRSHINRSEILNCELAFDQYPKKTLILNFNYTSVADAYLENYRHVSNGNTTSGIVHIHGEINNPNNALVFGFGDELDEDYKKIELTNVNEFFEHIKSFWYFKTSNYHELIRFIEDEEYQIYILGHSCGLSDRTLLHMLFENDKCKSIKIYYHGDKIKNNYTRLTQEISRHFSDKEAMRNKIVPFTLTEYMPQAN